MVELHRVTAASAGDGVQSRLIRQHLGGRDLGLDAALVAFAVHAQEGAAPAVDVAKDIAR